MHCCNFMSSTVVSSFGSNDPRPGGCRHWSLIKGSENSLSLPLTTIFFLYLRIQLFVLQLSAPLLSSLLLFFISSGSVSICWVRRSNLSSLRVVWSVAGVCPAASALLLTLIFTCEHSVAPEVRELSTSVIKTPTFITEVTGLLKGRVAKMLLEGKAWGTYW